jgi:hypothetical protein
MPLIPEDPYSPNYLIMYGIEIQTGNDVKAWVNLDGSRWFWDMFLMTRLDGSGV